MQEIEMQKTLKDQIKDQVTQEIVQRVNLNADVTSNKYEIASEFGFVDNNLFEIEDDFSNRLRRIY